MKLILVVLVTFICSNVSRSEFVFPPDVSITLSKSGVGESGGLFVDGMDRQRFLDFICVNWREIAENIESLPKAEGIFENKESAFNSSVETFGAACEALAPAEYLDFLDVFIKLRKEGRISQGSFENQLTGSSKKQDFLAVNWQHPRVKVLLNKSRDMVAVDESMLGWINSVSKGDLADNYMTNRSVDSPLPETLPGIKLRHPDETLIRKFERLTGKKVPRDPRFEPRTSRRNSPESPGEVDGDAKIEPSSAGKWIVGGILMLIAFVISRRWTKAHLFLQHRKNK